MRACLNLTRYCEYRPSQLTLTVIYFVCWLLQLKFSSIMARQASCMIYIHAVSTVAIGVHGRFTQGVINWNRSLCGCLSTAQVFILLVEGNRLPL